MSNIFSEKCMTLAFFGGIPGNWEWIILFVVILIIFGPKNLPKLGKALGKGIREFRDASKDLKKMVDLEGEEEEESYPKADQKKEEDKKEESQKSDLQEGKDGKNEDDD